VAYVAANRYGLGDLKPILYKTADYGKTWTKIVDGIPAEEFTRAIREDPVKRGLLYAATERGVWVSFDDGAHWQSLKINLPPVPVHDLMVKDGDLIAATHGRSFWIIDDLSPLRQLTPQVASAGAHLYKPRETYRVNWGGGFGGGDRGAHPSGANPPNGAIVYYKLSRPNQDVTLDFLDAKGALIKSFTSKLDSAGIADSVRADSTRRARADSVRRAGGVAATPNPEGPTEGGQQVDFEELQRRGPRAPRVPNKVGLNQFAWDLRYPDAVRFENLIMWAGNTTGPIVPPGTYQVRMTVAGSPAQTQTFVVKADPRSKATPADYAAQTALALKIRDKLSEANNAVRLARNVKAQLADRAEKVPVAARDRFASLSRELATPLSGEEGEIYQVQNQSSQDPLNYPIKLNNRIAALMGVVSAADGRPTRQSYVVLDTLTRLLDVQLKAMKGTIDTKLPPVNAELQRLGLPVIVPGTAEIKTPNTNRVMQDDDELDEKVKW
jgi:hypothetical protein